MRRRRFLVFVAGLAGVGAGFGWLVQGDGPVSGAPVPAALATPAAEAGRVAALLRGKQGEVNFPLTMPVDLADFVPPKVVDKHGPEKEPFVLFYLGYKADPKARISFAQTATSFGQIQALPASIASGVTKRDVTLLGSQATLVTATHNKTGANLVQLVWSHGGRTYWVEASGVPTDRILRLLSSVQPLN